MSAAAAAARRVCFVTDIEGNWRYMRNVVRQSTCLRFTSRTLQDAATKTSTTDASAESGDLDLLDDCFFVYGGDAGDKGGETLQCYEQLVRLKKKYPDRVVLLVGNRDVNKMRLTSELDDSEMDLHTMAKEIREGPTWVPIDKRVTLEMFLMRKATHSSDDATDCDASVLLEAANSKVNRLQWMLEHTMGAQGEFERRRTELAMRQSHQPSAAAAVSDTCVLQSYLDSVHNGGVLREYLELGSLAFVARDTLFVHGGIVNGDACVLGQVPDVPARRFDSVHEWVEALNAWYQRQVREWITQPTWTPDRVSRGGNTLLQYVLPDYPASVVMGRHLQASGMPMQVPSSVAQTLAVSGIKRLVVGHTPHGNCPTVIKQPAATTETATTFDEVIMCDTSYSNMAAADNRGDAAAELVLELDGRAHVHGVLDDGRSIAYSSDEPLIGRVLRDGTQVKAKLVVTAATDSADASDSRDECCDEYLVYAVSNGFSYTYHTRTRREIDSIGVLE